MEPMNLGSPVNSTNSSQCQYLPPFLMGDPQTLTSPQNNTLSPKTGRYNVSFATSPGNSSPQDFNRSALGARTLFGAAAAAGNPNNPSTANTYSGTPSVQHHNSSVHQAGPPTQGLFDSLRNENNAVLHTPPQRTHLGPLQTPPQRPLLGLLQTPHSQVNNTSYAMSPAASNYSYHAPTPTQLNDSYASNAPNASMRALCSPLGANMTPQPDISDFWVTVFGFSPGASSMILQHFTLCGTIVNVVHAPSNGNWMHVRFASRIECDKALNNNHKIIANNIMIGVVRCTDKSITGKENNNADVELSSVSRLRPFTQQSYRLAQHENAVLPNTNVPQRSTGLMNKAIDLLFSW